jgi:hypothetical protein
MFLGAITCSDHMSKWLAEGVVCRYVHGTRNHHRDWAMQEQHEEVVC